MRTSLSRKKFTAVFFDSMLKRYWLQYGPIGIALVGVVLMLAGAALNNHYLRSSQYRDSATYTQDQKAKDAFADQNARVGAAPSAPSAYEVADKDKGYAYCPSGNIPECDLAAQQSMAESTHEMKSSSWVSVALTGVGVLLLWLTLVATRGMLVEAAKTTKAAEDTVVETRRIGEAQVRAYLTLESEVDVSLDGICPVLHYVITNSGNSPALDIQVSAAADMSVFGDTSIPEPPTTSASHGIGTIAQGQSSEHQRLHIGTCSLSEVESTRLPTEPTLDIEIRVRLSFIDVFRKRRFETLRFYARMNQPAHGRRVRMYPLQELRSGDISETSDHD